MSLVSFQFKAADEELRWFFNEAESACEEPSNFVALLAGVTPEGRAQAVEARAEAIHAAGKGPGDGR